MMKDAADDYGIDDDCENDVARPGKGDGRVQTNRRGQEAASTGPKEPQEQGHRPAVGEELELRTSQPGAKQRQQSHALLPWRAFLFNGIYIGETVTIVHIGPISSIYIFQGRYHTRLSILGRRTYIFVCLAILHPHRCPFAYTSRIVF